MPEVKSGSVDCPAFDESCFTTRQILFVYGGRLTSGVSQ
jgi:hypothetical protein